ncbi:MAG: hypothetical protein HZB81_09010 [Deltaproteobacteria bacterium]|nr:hypothetical protein [Deltaproteobacteria bacterium]
MAKPMDITTSKRKARPARIRVSLRNEIKGVFLFRYNQKTWPFTLLLGIFFAIFAAIAFIQFKRIHIAGIKNISDLGGMLFQSFWLIGWSVGVVILGGLTLLLLLAGEQIARIYEDRLIHRSRLWPLWITSEYDLSAIKDVVCKNGEINFSYGDGMVALGGNLSSYEAERVVALIQKRAGDAPHTQETPEPVPPPSLAAPAPEPTIAENSPEQTSASSFLLIAANLVPLGGVIFFGWDLGGLMLLFWSESAVVGFYNILKLAVVGRLAAIFTIPFFIGHFGAFMSAHFMFIYYVFIQSGHDSGAAAGLSIVLQGVFKPLLPALAALFISHGVSFWTNFLGQKEYAGKKTEQQMMEPYKRIFIMQLTLIFGGWLLLLLNSPLPALLLLIILKTIVDLRAHRKEHAAAQKLNTQKMFLQ